MLQKGFLRNKNLWRISKFRFWYSAILGLLVAFFVYSFFCGFRLIHRLMSEMLFSNGPYIISEKARYWQNFTFAVFSLALGNAIFLGSIFRKPPLQKLKNYKRLSIINDQAFFPFGGFHFIAKLMILLSMISWGFFDLNEYKIPVALFTLLAVVIFLESWKSILLLFRKKIYKYQAVNFSILTILAFSVSNTSIFNYKAIDNVLQKNNVYVNLPESNYVNSSKYYYFLFLKMYEKDGKLTYEVNGVKNFNLSNLKKSIQELKRQRFYHHNYGYVRVEILAQQDLKMKYIKDLEKALFVSSIQKVDYITQYPEPRYTSRVKFEGLKKGLMFFEIEMDTISGNPSIPLPPKFTLKFDVGDTIIDINIGKRITYNNTEIKKEDLYSFFKTKINKTNIFNFNYSEDISFQEFITVYSNYSKALDDLRSEIHNVPFEEDNYNRVYQEKYEAEQRRVIEFYPKRYLENYSFENATKY